MFERSGGKADGTALLRSSRASLTTASSSSTAQSATEREELSNDRLLRPSSKHRAAVSSFNNGSASDADSGDASRLPSMSSAEQ